MTNYLHGNAGGLVMTPYARKLVEPLAIEISTLVARTGSFDPAKAERSFNIALIDAAEILIISEILARLKSDAPGLQLILTPLDQMNVCPLMCCDQVCGSARVRANMRLCKSELRPTSSG